MSDYEQFRIYLDKTKNVFLYAVGPSVFVPVIAYFSSIIPPNPVFAGLLSSLFVVLVSIVVFAKYSRQSLRRRSRVISAAFGLLCILVIIYTILFQLFIFSPTGSNAQIVVGCGYKEDILIVAEDRGLSLKHQCPGEPELILDEFNYDERKIWTTFSRVTINTALFAIWIAILTFTTVIITTLLCGFKFSSADDTHSKKTK